MEIEQKVKILKSLGTKDLITKLHECEEELEKGMKSEAEFKAQNHSYLGSGDCQEVKRLLAELAVQAPDANEAGKKTTVADREAWLAKQRTENKELAAAIIKQREVSFLTNDWQIKVESTRRRLEGIRGILALKTQQLAFLASG